MPRLEIEYHDTPPSLNQVGARGGVRMFHRQKRVWQDSLEKLLMQARLPRDLTSVKASAVLRFSTSQRRDEGNYRALLEKALGDALVNGGWLPDDTPEHFTFGAVEFDADRGPHLTTITINYEEG